MMTDGLAVPDFLLAGVHKSGTSALSRALGTAVGLTMLTPKEPHTLALKGLGGCAPTPSGRSPLTTIPMLVSSLERYGDLVRNSAQSGASLVGDASVWYAWFWDEVLSHYRELKVAAPRVVAVVRKPEDRLGSSYRYASRHNPYEVNSSLESAIVDELEGRRSRLPPAVQHLSASFNADRLAAVGHGTELLVVTLDRLIQDPGPTLSQISEFCGGRPARAWSGEEFALPRVNEGQGDWASPALGRAIRSEHLAGARALAHRFPGARDAAWRALRALRVTRPSRPSELLSPTIRSYVADRTRVEIEQLSGLCCEEDLDHITRWFV